MLQWKRSGHPEGISLFQQWNFLAHSRCSIQIWWIIEWSRDMDAEVDYLGRRNQSKELLRQGSQLGRSWRLWSELSQSPPPQGLSLDGITRRLIYIHVIHSRLYLLITREALKHPDNWAYPKRFWLNRSGVGPGHYCIFKLPRWLQMLPRLKAAWIISWTPQVPIARDPQIVFEEFH